MSDAEDHGIVGDQSVVPNLSTVPQRRVRVASLFGERSRSRDSSLLFCQSVRLGGYLGALPVGREEEPLAGGEAMPADQASSSHTPGRAPASRAAAANQAVAASHAATWTAESSGEARLGEHGSGQEEAAGRSTQSLLLPLGHLYVTQDFSFGRGRTGQPSQRPTAGGRGTPS